MSLDERASVGPSLALADAFVSLHPSTSVGLIPCAKGGSSISDWEKRTTQPRSTLYGSCMTRMKVAAPANGTIRAVLFWQGGEDTKTLEDALKWKERFTTFVADLRADLGNPNLPIVLVMLGTPDNEVLKKRPYWEVVRGQQRSVNLRGVVKIEADGYERKDGIHFTTRGQLAFGPVLAGLLPAP